MFHRAAPSPEIDKTPDKTDIYISSDFLDGAIHFFTVVRMRQVPEVTGAHLQGVNIDGNIGDVFVDCWLTPAGAASIFRMRIAVDPILPIPSRALRRALEQVVRRTAWIVRRESEAATSP